jgi:hypothetical protein
VSEETTNVRITQAMIYAKQLEMHEVQVRMLSKLDQLEDVPERIRQVELTLARLAWIEKIAYTALSAGIVSLIGAVIGLLAR